MERSSETPRPALDDLLTEYRLAQDHSLALVADLDEAQIAWRPVAESSAIGWHLGHQGAVNHYLVRNLTAAEPSFDPELDALFDSATPEPDRGALPPLAAIVEYREAIAASTRTTIGRIAAGDVAAPTQLALVADVLLRAVVNHEYQHAAWIEEVRASLVPTPAPTPASRAVRPIEGYWTIPAR